jgi:ATP-dependent Lhr-like helicase
MFEKNTPVSKSFDLLDERIQRWIWQNEWTELFDVQERSIPLILRRTSDIILSAETASGKTEAAFLPVLSYMLSKKNGAGLSIYISPLAALINDQFARLSELCAKLEIPVHPWHGGISASIKKDFFTNPCGILLITPESLEALFCLHGFEIPQLLSGAEYIVIDELHSFIGSERGKQLQTLIYLMEERTKKTIPRIGLSATLGDMRLAADFLSAGRPCELIVSDYRHNQIKLLLKGITEKKALPSGKDDEAQASNENNENEEDNNEDDVTASAADSIVEYLFEKLHGTNSLVFPNTRSKVELFTHLLSTCCKKHGLANEFFAHHGNLSKEIRLEAEEALRSKERCATVICTNTLELGIDIGDVESVVQIESPPSVSSLRQRLGRSGRRAGQPAILRAFSIEKAKDAANHPFSQLRERTLEFCACITLMLEGWCEPPPSGGLHLSTLVQQILALILECNGISPQKAVNTLCVHGPFSPVSQKDFFILVKALIACELVEQDSRGALLLGERGERRAGHFSFYASFESKTEYRIVTQEKTLGTIPLNSSMQKGDIIIFAGKTWRIRNINDTNKTIEVKFSGEGRPPVFTGSGWSIHKKVRERMRELYKSDEAMPFADSGARRLIDEGRAAFIEYELNNKNNFIIEKNKYSVLFSWLGDKGNRTLQLLFRYHDVSSYTGGLGLTVPGKSGGELAALLEQIQQEEMPQTDILLRDAQNLSAGKWDWVLPPRLLKENYASLYLDTEEAAQWLKGIVIL